MGNCFGKEKKGGQVLGTAEQSSNRTQYEAVKSQAARKTGDSPQNPGPGRPVGGQSGNPTAQDPRAAAAQAAEVSTQNTRYSLINHDRHE
jgi:hypothetical protein